METRMGILPYRTRKAVSYTHLCHYTKRTHYREHSCLLKLREHKHQRPDRNLKRTQADHIYPPRRP